MEVTALQSFSPAQSLSSELRITARCSRTGGYKTTVSFCVSAWLEFFIMKNR